MNSSSINQSDWDACDDLVSAYTAVINQKYESLLHLVETWDDMLADLGGDPTHIDWNSFHVLRLSREEDWSDWLSFLIERSETGVFASNLFETNIRTNQNYSKPKMVVREVPQDQYRADLIVQWADEYFYHIEVKVGDSNLFKTYATSQAMQSKFGQSSDRWTDYILLLSNQIPDWESMQNHKDRTIHMLTWEDVSVSLRLALQSNESILWKSWAYSFIGAIEQLLIGYSGHLLHERPFNHVETKIHILKKGLINDNTK